MPTSVPLRRCRGIPFTQNNWTSESYAELRKFGESNCLYMVLGKEVGESGTPHIQGFLYFENPHVYPCKKFRDISRGSHDEIMRGTPKQAADYCKKGGDFWEHGTVPSQGARTDWDAALNDLREYSSPIHAIDQQPHLATCIRALERYQQLSLRSTHRELKVYVIVGEPGTGKSRWAWDNFPELYSKPEGHWWDGYSGQDTILLDDYYGDIPYTTLLKVCDRYPLLLPVKGGFVPAKYTTVIITSNRSPYNWNYGNINAFFRRITSYHLDSIPDAPQETHVEVPCCPPQGSDAPPQPPEGS